MKKDKYMKLFSYIVNHDSGFSPNPFWGYCTLACCKPTIRRTAKPGDWIVGLSSKSLGHKVVFFMEVQEVLSFKEYFKDPRFKKKKPNSKKGDIISERGDNIYKPLTNGLFKQLESMHSYGVEENKDSKGHDLKGKNVLISKNFVYFGKKAIELPPRFNDLKVGRGHRNRFTDELVKDFVKFASKYKTGRRASPTRWPIDDKSRREGKK